MSLTLGMRQCIYVYVETRKVVKILHYERGFYVLYEKRPIMGKVQETCV